MPSFPTRAVALESATAQRAEQGQRYVDVALVRAPCLPRKAVLCVVHGGVYGTSQLRPTDFLTCAPCECVMCTLSNRKGRRRNQRPRGIQLRIVEHEGDATTQGPNAAPASRVDRRKNHVDAVEDRRRRDLQRRILQNEF